MSVYGEYYNRGSIFQGDRAFSRSTQADVFDPVTGSSTGLVPGGSAGVPQGRFVAAATINLAARDLNNDGDTLDPGEFAAATPNRWRTEPRRRGAFSSAGPAACLRGQRVSGRIQFAPRTIDGSRSAGSSAAYGEFDNRPQHQRLWRGTFVNNRVQNELAATTVTQNVDLTSRPPAPTSIAATCALFQQVGAKPAGGDRPGARLAAIRIPSVRSFRQPPQSLQPASSVCRQYPHDANLEPNSADDRKRLPGLGRRARQSDREPHLRRLLHVRPHPQSNIRKGNVRVRLRE